MLPRVVFSSPLPPFFFFTCGIPCEQLPMLRTRWREMSRHKLHTPISLPPTQLEYRISYSFVPKPSPAQLLWSRSAGQRENCCSYRCWPFWAFLALKRRHTEGHYGFSLTALRKAKSAYIFQGIFFSLRAIYLSLSL